MAKLTVKKPKVLSLGVSPAPKDPTERLTKSNDKQRAKLAALGVADPTKTDKPNLLERLTGPLDVLGSPTRALVHNLFNKSSDADIDPLAEMGRAMKGEARQAEGSHLMADMGVENKWAQLGGGIAIDILLDPVTYLTLGYGAATKAGAAEKALTLAADIADPAIDAATIATKYGDDIARMVEGAATVDELAKPTQRAILTALRTNAAKEVGEKTGLKMFGQTVLDVQPQADKVLGRVTDALDTLPGLRTIERAVTPGALADIRRSQGPLAAEAAKVADFVRNKGLTHADTVAIEYGRGMMKALPDDARNALPRAIEAAVDPFRADLDTAWKAVKGLGDDAEPAAREAAQASLDNVLANLADGYDDRVRQSLTSQGVKDIDQAADAAVAFRGKMDEALAKTQAAGIPDPSLTGAGAYGYVPHIDDPEPVFWDKLKAWARGDKEAFAETPRLRTRGGGARPDQPKSRTLMTIAEREAKGLGTETDAAVLGASKVRAVERNAVKASYEDRIAKMFGHEVTDGAKPGADEVVHSLTRNGVKTEYIIPTEVERHLQKFGEAFTSDEATNGILRGYDRVLGVWKKMATSWNPGFHGRNLGSNYLLAYLHDTAQPYGWTNAPAVMLGRGSVQLGEKGAVEASEVLAKAKEFGVVSGEFVRSEVGTSLKASLKPLWQRLPSEAGSAVEDTSRVAVFINGLRKGLDYEGAAMLANRVMYDYSPQALSGLERNVGRRLFPFMVWQRRNLPNMLDVLIHQPGKIGQFAHVKEVAEAVTPVDQSIMPEYIQDLFAIPLPMQDKSGNTVMLNPNVPMQDLTKIGSVKDTLSSVSPLLKTPAELVLNRDFYFGGEVRQYPGQTRRAPGYLEAFDDLVMQLPGMDEHAAEWTKFKSAFGIIEKTDKQTGEVYLAIPAFANKALRDLSPWLNNVGKVMEVATGTERPAAPYQALAAGTGLKLIPFETDKFAEQKAYDDQEALADTIRRLSAEGKTAPAPKKLVKLTVKKRN